MSELSELMASILASNIKALRLRMGLDQTQFGERLEVSQSSVARWEGGAEPRHKYLTQMAEMAGTSLDHFMTRLITERLPIAGGRSGSSIYLPVSLPSEEALTEMFDGLLEVLEGETDRFVRAQRLAQLLPDALGQTAMRATTRPADAEDAADRPLGAAPQREVGPLRSR